MNDGSRGLSLGGALAGILLGIVALVAPTHGMEPGTPTRVDLFDKSSNRTGAAIIDEKTGRVDLYDTKSNRTGYGTIDKSRRIDLFDLKGNRTGSGQIAPGSIKSGVRR